MAVRIAAGLGVRNTRKPSNLSALRRKCRAGRKQGRKRGPDSVEMCAPDSVRAKKTKVRYKVPPVSYDVVWSTMLWSSSDRQHLSYGDCLEVRGEIIRTVLCCIVYWKLCTVIGTLRWAVLTVLWIGFCLTGPISLCVDSCVIFCVVLSYCICVVLL